MFRPSDELQVFRVFRLFDANLSVGLCELSVGWPVSALGFSSDVSRIPHQVRVDRDIRTRRLRILTGVSHPYAKI